MFETERDELLAEQEKLRKEQLEEEKLRAEQEKERLMLEQVRQQRPSPLRRPLNSFEQRFNNA